MVVVLVPSAIIVGDEAVIVVVDALTGPGTKFTVALSVIETPVNVPVIVASPVAVDDVSVAVYVPLPLSVTDESDPRSLDKTTEAPPPERLFPLISLS